MLSNKIITHRVIIRNADGKGVTKYPLTKDMYVNYRLAKSDRKIWSTIWITDIDGNKLREIDPIKLEEFEEVVINPSIAEKRWVCSWWNRHPLSMLWECSCNKEFDCLSFQMKDRLKEMWYNIQYSTDITEEHRIAYKKKYLTK